LPLPLRPRMEPHDKIFAKAEELFLKYGVRSISMDDIARELGMSKKTLYIVAKNKEELIFKVLENHFERERGFCCQLMHNTSHAIEEMLLLTKHFMEQFRDTNQAVMFDLKKYYPKAFRLVDDYRNTFVFENILSNIKKGIKQGLYRRDFNPELIARFYTAKFDLIFNSDTFPLKTFSLSDINRESIIYHIRGIASEKGLEYLNENIKKIK
jgi:TetR/AcrR family transcriptional regulator, cholesterol catabolism regulator